MVPNTHYLFAIYPYHKEQTQKFVSLLILFPFFSKNTILKNDES